MSVNSQTARQQQRVQVYSVPVGRSAQVVQDHRVYACPQSYNPPECEYLAPRLGGGGQIPYLYRVISTHDVATRILDKHLISIAQANDQHGHNVAARVRAYFGDPRGKTDAGDEELVVYVLHETAFELPHRPHPKRNNPFRTGRWTLAELMDPLLVELPTS